MPVPGLSLLGLERIRGFLSILRYINPTIIIIITQEEILHNGCTHLLYSSKLCGCFTGADLSVTKDFFEGRSNVYIVG